MSAADLKKKRSALSRESKKITREIRSHESSIAERMVEMDRVAVDLEKASANYSKLEDNANELQKLINNKLYEKQRNMDATQKNQRLLDRYTKSRLGQMAPLMQEDQTRVEEELRREEMARDAVRSTIEHLAAQHPHLSEVLDRVMRLTEV